MARLFAIILNLIMLGAFAYMLAEQGLPRDGEPGEWFLVLLWLALPICNLISIFKTDENSWLTLYFRRKALEEKRKIEKLSETEKETP